MRETRSQWVPINDRWYKTKPGRVPNNVPTGRQMDFDSRVCYPFRPKEDAISEISVEAIRLKGFS
jgi:hypothetical protein